VQKIIIRKAIPEDAYGIHLAHMNSIRTLCKFDYTEEETSAWSGIEFNQDRRLHAINHQYVFVLTLDDVIEGYGHFTVLDSVSYLQGLYLNSIVAQKGHGSALFKMILEECDKLNVIQMSLHSTLTAHQFYLKWGFVDTGPITTILINQKTIRCIPMLKNLAN
jgi:GNAT superfamily N-acetyltransferase